MWRTKSLRHLLRILGIAILGGLLSATLVRLAPGFDVDEQQLDSRLNADSLRALRAARSQDRNVARFYLHYLAAAAHGDLGESRTFNRPVRQLIGERLPVTLRLVSVGLLMGWALALFLAVTTTMARLAAYHVFAAVLAGVLLSVPAAVMGLALVYYNAPAYIAIALLVLPKVFSYTRGLLRKSYALPHIITARAKGVGPLGILLRHVLPVSGPELLALAAVSVSLALGAAIPVEALCGIPGIGELAWQAALGRDLPLLVNLTLLVTLITLIANSTSDVLSSSMGKQAA